MILTNSFRFSNSDILRKITLMADIDKHTPDTSFIREYEKNRVSKIEYEMI